LFFVGIAMKACPCGLTKTYDECCGNFIAGTAFPKSPEELMRSRYTAYTEANIDYIMATMKEPANLLFDPLEARAFAQSSQWLKLEVTRTFMNDGKGYVEFFAHYMQNNKPFVLHELSEFRCDEGKWFYVDGDSPRIRLRKQKK
jgi:SEC-C motif domain protein